MGTLRIKGKVLLDHLDAASIVDATARTAAATAQSAADAAQADVDGLEVHSTTAADTGQKWTDGHAIFRKVVAITAGPNANTITVAHGIATIVTLVRMDGMLKAGAVRISLPFVAGDVLKTGIEVQVDATNITLTSAEDMHLFAGHMILEYTAT